MNNRTFFVAFRATDAELPGLIADNIQAGRMIEKIGVINELPYFKNKPKNKLLERHSPKNSAARESVILSALKKNGPMNGGDLKRAFVAQGFAEGGFNPTRTRLITRGLITSKKVGAGTLKIWKSTGG